MFSISFRCRIRPAHRPGPKFRPENNCSKKRCAKSRATPRLSIFGQKVGAVDLNRPSRLMNKMSSRLRVTIWNENVHEQKNPTVAKIYPNGIHGCIADALKIDKQMDVRTATLEEPEHGLTEKVLEETDVLTWWGHAAHGDVSENVVGRVHARVLNGMGIVVLHSGHHSKIFRKLMGTSCDLRWRSDPGGERELVWTVKPAHPIAAGVPQPIVIPRQEMYGEFFDIPTPDELVFISSFAGGEGFRGGWCFFRGAGRGFCLGTGRHGC